MQAAALPSLADLPKWLASQQHRKPTEMDETPKSSAHSRDHIAEATSRVSELEAELEISTTTTVEEAQLLRAKALLHDWVDTISAVVSTPGSGRVVLIHENGRESRISSPDLPYTLSVPVTFGQRDG